MRVLYIDTSSSYLYAGIVENKKLLCLLTFHHNKNLIYYSEV